RRAVDPAQQIFRGLIVADVTAGIHIAVAGAVLQRNAPSPARFARGAAHVWRGRTDVLARHRDRAVAGQPVRPVFVSRAQRLFDQQAAKTGAVDEQIAGDALAALQYDRLDETVFALHDFDDFSLGAPRAARFGVAAQKFRVQARIEMIGV